MSKDAQITAVNFKKQPALFCAASAAPLVSQIGSETTVAASDEHFPMDPAQEDISFVSFPAWFLKLSPLFLFVKSGLLFFSFFSASS